MKELSVQATSGTYSATDRDAMDLEFQQLKSEITRIETNTTWNGQVLMDGQTRWPFRLVRKWPDHVNDIRKLVS